MTHRKILWLVLLLLGIAGRESAAQDKENHALATRTDLQDLLGPQGKQALSSGERQLVQARLEQGDFQAGDRILLRVRETAP